MINAQINKLCNNLEDSQPYLKMCLNFNEADLDKRLVCLKCNNIVCHPVECRNCSVLICYKCAQQPGNMVCDEEGCGESFSKTPGKIHKLYKEMLSQLEFRCPNQAHGCNKTIKYDQIDNHL